MKYCNRFQTCTSAGKCFRVREFEKPSWHYQSQKTFSTTCACPNSFGILQCLLHIPQAKFALTTAKKLRKSRTWAKAGACVANLAIYKLVQYDSIATQNIQQQPRTNRKHDRQRSPGKLAWAILWLQQTTKTSGVTLEILGKRDQKTLKEV